jgi:hypothetical protein
MNVGRLWRKVGVHEERPRQVAEELDDTIDIGDERLESRLVTIHD